MIIFYIITIISLSKTVQNSLKFTILNRRNNKHNPKTEDMYFNGEQS